MLWIKAQLFLTSLLTAEPTTTPIPEKLHKYVNSATSGSNVGDEVDYGTFGKMIEDGFAWIGDKLLDVIGPFANWGSRIIIVSCFLIFYLSQEKKYIATAWKFGILYALYWTIRSAVK